MASIKSFLKVRLEIDLELALFNFLFKQNPCSSSPCLNGGTCQVGFTSKGYRCICRTGFPGINCSPGIASVPYLLQYRSYSNSVHHLSCALL